MSDADEIEAIRQLKYRYFRFLDQKRYDDLEELLLPDCTFSYHSGTYTYPNRDAAVAFLKERMHKPECLSLHQGHHPEITLVSPTEATGIWYLQDVVFFLDDRTRLDGNGWYDDRYVKVGGEWKIAHTGYDRSFEITTKLPDDAEVFNGFAEGGAFRAAAGF
jgi:SnoaL-like domain